MMRLFPIRVLPLLAAFLLAQPLHAQEEQFTNYHCAVTPPLGWKRLTTQPQPGVIATWGNTSRKGLLMLIINDRGKIAPLDDRFIAEFDRGIQMGTQGRDKKISGKVIQLG